MGGAQYESITDGYGYVLRGEDIDFLGLTDDAIASFQARHTPLGMSAEAFADFLTTLRDALATEGITDADIRLKGSSAEFFSGHHKFMPFDDAGGVDRGQVLAAFRRARKRTPKPYVLTQIMERVSAQWPEDASRPKRRPFDVMHRVGIDEEPSDYDVQISSEQILQKARQLIVDLKLEPTDLLVMNDVYKFISKDIFHDACPVLEDWRVRQSKDLGRPVTIAAFPGAGPTRVDGPLSSHFRTSDWVISVEAGVRS